MHITKWKSWSKKTAHCMISTIWPCQNGKIRETVKVNSCQKFRENGKWMRASQVVQIFMAVKLFCMILWWWSHVFLYLNKPMECTTASMNPNVNYGLWVIVRVKSLKLCPTVCNPMDCSLSGPSVHGILQARILEWVAISFSRGSSRPRDQTCVSHIAGRRFNLWATSHFGW